jgi:hypothetical protein
MLLRRPLCHFDSHNRVTVVYAPSHSTNIDNVSVFLVLCLFHPLPPSQVAVEQGQAEMVRVMLHQSASWRQWADAEKRSSLALAAQVRTVINTCHHISVSTTIRVIFTRNPAELRIQTRPLLRCAWTKHVDDCVS